MYPVISLKFCKLLDDLTEYTEEIGWYGSPRFKGPLIKSNQHTQ